LAISMAISVLPLAVGPQIIMQVFCFINKVCKEP
jgi:hypothetical protein